MKTKFNMIRNLSLVALAALFSFTSVTAQEDADALLADMSEKMATFESVSANFSATMVDKAADLTMKKTGSMKISGDKYRLKMDDFTVISDGSNIWAYDAGSNEVTVDLAEESYDEAGVRPADLFTIWETGFKRQYAGQETIGGVVCEVIKLFPNEPEDKPFHTIKIYIDKKSMELKRAVIMDKVGADTTYDITAFKTDFIKSDVFTFSKAEYPGVEVIDNR